MARGTHKVKSGETIFTIARQYYGDDSAAKYISQANGGITQARIGSILKLPKVTAVGERGTELIFNSGDQNTVVPAEESARMLQAGLKPDNQMALGGSYTGPLLEIGNGQGITVQQAQSLYQPLPKPKPQTTASILAQSTLGPKPDYIKQQTVKPTKPATLQSPSTKPLHPTAAFPTGNLKPTAPQAPPGAAVNTLPHQQSLVEQAMNTFIGEQATQGIIGGFQDLGSSLGNVWDNFLQGMGMVKPAVGTALGTTAQQTGYMLHDMALPNQPDLMGTNMPTYQDYTTPKPKPEQQQPTGPSTGAGFQPGGGQVAPPGGSLHPLMDGSLTAQQVYENMVGPATGSFTQAAMQAWDNYYSKPVGTDQHLDLYLEQYLPFYLSSVQKMEAGGAILYHVPEAIVNSPNWPYSIDEMLAMGYEADPSHSYYTLNPNIASGNNVPGYDGTGTGGGTSYGGGGGGGGGGGSYYSNGGGNYIPKLSLLISWRGVGFG